MKRITVKYVMSKSKMISGFVDTGHQLSSVINDTGEDKKNRNISLRYSKTKN
jgi:hypothetical protein